MQGSCFSADGSLFWILVPNGCWSLIKIKSLENHCQRAENSGRKACTQLRYAGNSIIPGTLAVPPAPNRSPRPTQGLKFPNQGIAGLGSHAHKAKKSR
jgi:hypothetical protein